MEGQGGDPKTGSSLSHYELLRKLGQGGMGEVTDEPTQMPLHVVSPDGKWIVDQPSAGSTTSVHARQIEGERLALSCDAEPSERPSDGLAVGDWIYYQSDHKNIYRLPGPAQGWRTAAPQKITNSPGSGFFIEDPRLSADGKQLIYSRGKITGDLWLLRFGKSSSK